MSTASTTFGEKWGRGLRIALLAASALLYAFAGLSGLVHLLAFAGLGGLTPVGWVVLLFGVVLPVIVFLLALAIVRGKDWQRLTLVMLAGLGVVAAFRLSLLAYSLRNIGTLVAV